MLFFPLGISDKIHNTIDVVHPDLQELARAYAGNSDPFVCSEKRLKEIAACAVKKDLFGKDAGACHSVVRRLFENSIGLRDCWHDGLLVFNSRATELLRKNLEAARAANEESFKRIMAAAQTVKEAIDADGALVLEADALSLPSDTIPALFEAAKELFMSGNCVVGLQHVHSAGQLLPSSWPSYTRCVVGVLEAYRRILLAADRAYRRLHDPDEVDCIGCTSAAEGAELWRMSAGNDAARQMGLLLQDVAHATFDAGDAGYIVKRVLPNDAQGNAEYHGWVLDELSQEEFEDSWDERDGFDYSGLDLNDQGFYGLSDDLHEWVGESSLAAQRVASWVIGATDYDFDMCYLNGTWPGASFLGWEDPENFEFARALAESTRSALQPLSGHVRARVNKDGWIEIPKEFLDGCNTAYVRVETGDSASGGGEKDGKTTGARLVCRSRRRAAELFAKKALAGKIDMPLGELFSLSLGKILVDADALLCGPAEEPASVLALAPGDEVLVEGHGDYFIIKRL